MECFMLFFSNPFVKRAAVIYRSFPLMWLFITPNFHRHLLTIENFELNLFVLYRHKSIWSLRRHRLGKLEVGRLRRKEGHPQQEDQWLRRSWGQRRGKDSRVMQLNFLTDILRFFFAEQLLVWEVERLGLASLLPGFTSSIPAAFYIYLDNLPKKSVEESLK